MRSLSFRLQVALFPSLCSVGVSLSPGLQVSLSIARIPMNHSEHTEVLSGRDIHKTFRRESGELVHALDGISLEVEPGTLAALVGPDGAGKTTIIRLAAGLMTIDRGRAQDPGGRCGCRSPASPRPHRLHAAEVRAVRRFERARESRPVRRSARRHCRRTAPALPAPDGDDRAWVPSWNVWPDGYQGGMKQKLGLACTLVRAPELLLLDEPTVGVDPLSRRELWEIILQLVKDQGLTVLLSTSYLDEAERCDRVIVMHQGKVLARGRPEDVSGLAAGRAFIAEPPAGQKAREFQARLLDHEAVLDAVPEGGRVRLVVKKRIKDEGERINRSGDHEASSIHPLSLIPHPLPVPPRFEDGFMILLRQSTDTETRRQGEQTKTDKETQVSPAPCLSTPSSRCVTWCVSLAVSPPWITLVSRFSAARSSACSVQTVPARRRPFACSAACYPPASGTLRVAGVGPAPGARRGAAADRLRRAEVLALRAALGERESRILRQRLWPARRAKARPHRVGLATVRACPAGWIGERSSARRLQAAAGDGSGLVARAGDFVPG